MVSPGMTCIKYLLFVFNLLFAVSGIAILSVGAIILTSYSNYSPFVTDGFFTASAVLIAVGVIIFVVAFFGCCGAVRENHCMIITFSVLLLAIFLLEVSVGIAGYLLQDDVKAMVDERINSTLYDYGKIPVVTAAWNTMQQDMECCGIHSYTDWKAVFNNDTLPETCCASVPVGEFCQGENAYPEGCQPKLQEKMEHNAVVLGGVGIGIACIQLIGVIFACCLARSIRREYETV